MERPRNRLLTRLTRRDEGWLPRRGLSDIRGPPDVRGLPDIQTLPDIQAPPNLQALPDINGHLIPRQIDVNPVLTLG